MESQFKEYFYDTPGSKPERMVGKNDEFGKRLIPWTGELSPLQLAVIVAQRLDSVFDGLHLSEKAARRTEEKPLSLIVDGATRTPFFCSGCPHNRSTKVPQGSEALAGIGCHFMASWMDRDTNFLIQMGGEGVNWIAKSQFNGKKHIFQNLGDGTYYHSGILAIRQAIAAKTNITYKILYNDATAMTGGQPFDGPVSVQSIAHSLRAEGIERIALLSDAIQKFNTADFPDRVTFDDRTKLDEIQRELRDIPGVTALIYEQTCATEKRRRRKRGLMEDVPRFAFINEAVCEGCGDCSVASNCLSVEPLETEFGRKRQINQSACNKDFSCLEGFCPSFVTIEGGRRKRPRGEGGNAELMKALGKLREPELPSSAKPFDILITGVGGTGVITVGQLITMAAHLENKGATVLDFMGFAQKFGPVLSYIRLADDPDQINQVRIDEGRADALIGCDFVVSTSPKASVTYKSGHTKGAVNLAAMPTGDFTLNPDADLKADHRLDLLKTIFGEEHTHSVDANLAAEMLLGDAVFANVLLLGFSWQQGLVPVSLEALMRAIALNGVAIEKNRDAFNWGRVLFADPKLRSSVLSRKTVKSVEPESFSELLKRNAAFLTRYQDKSWSSRYLVKIENFQKECENAGAKDEELAKAFAKSLFKLMSYKDEYEVARLHSQESFRKRIEETFEGEYKIHYHMAPPLLSRQKDSRGRPLKTEFGPWMEKAFSLLAKMKRLRGTVLDPFGYTEERRMERGLIDWYEKTAFSAVQNLEENRSEDLKEILALPMKIKGYGPVKEENVRLVRTRMKELQSG
ncbi:MAG: indolepyruvate ferredoxin oxidoreductase family protein [Sneathiellales bacterium]|nr:indolepyruvate ferredoxin oxidoreductase family protein [Sneathiellales bacterium]